ncbi:VIT1/CCC1 transporter family protein [Chitinophaga sp. GCM10012297]|uniref:VIT1/CCC1 transporter family protein n=1 Tax=Chitinophaga chungangae TaxID=2821488 RepID=A0ABS3YI58_9BACT|nr:VIT1/CCC1 transporter family protein [Chitinophaga chungangae]MBO9154324.1 VIT1/CCC1 transporter family protein [Chitinophaga chungangae]
MSTNTKAIRSSGWKTDMMIGFPDGVLLLLFTTQVLYSKSLTVQAFYIIHFLVIGFATLLMMIAVFRANRGDEEDGTMSPEEKEKLEKLDISDNTIAHIADEMQKDQQVWEKTLEEEAVELRSYGTLHALRSMIATGVFFFLGSCVVFLPYLVQEDFPAASRTSLTVSLLLLLVFALLKSKITGQGSVRMALRYLLTGGAVVLVSYMISSFI